MIQTSISRRRLLKTLFCSSVAMKLNLSATANGNPLPGQGLLDLLAIGDFGMDNKDQQAVADAMIRYSLGLGRPPEGMLMLGDNFYKSMPGGVASPRWKTGFSDMYPSSAFPGKCWAILGNHDYHDTAGNEQVQLNYAASLDRKTRWTMPGKYYRVDLPADKPIVTFLMIDTNYPMNDGRNYLSAEERDAQKKWLESQLTSSRAPFTVVVGHHPLYSDGAHGDGKILIKDLGELFENHGVHLYLCGHDHDLQHLELDGKKTSFVISGGGGAGLRPHEKSRKGAISNVVHGFSHLSFTEDRLHLRHLNREGKIVHAFSKGVQHDWKIEA
jgi:tartrate-resistant acid phosphatase type 5